jgi:hypothetical protein
MMISMVGDHRHHREERHRVISLGGPTSTKAAKVGKSEKVAVTPTLDSTTRKGPSKTSTTPSPLALIA